MVIQINDLLLHSKPHEMTPKSTQKDKTAQVKTPTPKRNKVTVTFPSQQKALFTELISISKTTGLDLAALSRMALKSLVKQYNKGVFNLSDFAD